MRYLAELQALLATDTARMGVLGLVRDLGLPDCWVGAGFVRSCVWDHLHGCAASPLPDDIDVIWFDPHQASAERDAEVEALLRARDPTSAWSVKNQSRMHLRNADPPYRSALDAMRCWPETATTVGIRVDRHGAIEVAAPFGLDDLFDGVLKPTPRFETGKYPIFLERVRAKRWRMRWPHLRIDAGR